MHKEEGKTEQGREHLLSALNDQVLNLMFENDLTLHEFSVLLAATIGRILNENNLDKLALDKNDIAKAFFVECYTKTLSYFKNTEKKENENG